MDFTYGQKNMIGTWMTYFDIQDEIAGSITEKLKITFLEKEAAQVWRNIPANTEACNLYLKGKFCMDKRLILRAITFATQPRSGWPGPKCL